MLGALIARFRPPKPSAETAPGGPPKSAAPRPASAVRTVVKKAPRLKAKSKKLDTSNVKSAGEEHDPELIEFKVKDHLAIAFGDVILGEMDDEEPMQAGLYRPPAPQLWRDREIPYAIDADLPNPERVERAIKYYMEHTPVVFTPYQGQEDAILFQRGKEHCYSLLGKTGGLQPIKLADDCGVTEILHEVMHALGFIHEHSRTDRDNFLEVVWDNVDPEFKQQFSVVSPAQMGPVKGTPFDLHSIMLYPSTLFAKKPGDITLRSRTTEPIAPVTERLSEGDLERLNTQYK